MEGRLHFRLANSASVTTFAYHPIRREIVTGHEGEIRTNATLVATCKRVSCRPAVI